jgi:hypothetical protein
MTDRNLDQAGNPIAALEVKTLCGAFQVTVAERPACTRLASGAATPSR